MADKRRKPARQRKDTVYQLRLTSEELEAYRQRAEREGFSSIAEWFRWHAKRILREPPPP